MAKFVLAGKADCPYYAKAELLADALRLSLPDFKTRKICILPEEWKEWLEATCAINGWKHDKSPLIWRELVEQGGKGMLVGGFSDFLEHCQEYYSITSDMPTETMLSLSVENLETKMNLIKEEEQLHNHLINALHIWISGALNPTCHILIPNLLCADVFPQATAIVLHMLEMEGDEEELKGLKMETEDLALPLLHQVTIHTGLELAFQDADVILLLDEWPDGKDTENESEEEKLKKMTECYREYSELINTRAKKEVKVIVAGDSFVNLKCSLLVEKAHFADRHRFVTMATELENVARAVLAKRLKVRASDIKDVIVWGNLSGTFYTDLQRAKVFNYNGPIKGPPFFSQSLLKIFHDRKWLETDFQDLVRCQLAAVVARLSRTAAMSKANGILTILKAWNGTCSPDDIFSLGVLCPGDYGLPDAIVLSVPVTFTHGKWSAVLDVTVGDELWERLQLSAAEILQGQRADDITITDE